MTPDPSGLEILFLWRLATAGGGDWKKAIKPELDGPTRRRLLAAGLIEEEKRSPEGGGRKLLHFALTDRGWQWLAGHLDAPIATRSPAALEVLVRLLGRLRAHLDAREISLAEFIASAAEDGPAARDGLDRRVESAYLALSGGKSNVRVRLADLRDNLSDLAREDLDATLLAMASAGLASLYRLDNPLEIEPRDREATLRTPSGEDRHVVYLGGRGS
jgi:hypothetical protein